MVGVPTSNGCQTCRRRSIKCDESRPSCSQCRRGGRPCPGYTRCLKFIDQNPSLHKKRATRKLPTAILTHSDKHLHEAQHRTQLVASFVQDLFPSDEKRRQCSFIGGWMWLLPSVLHEFSVLDSSAEAVALGYFGKQAKCKDSLMRSYVVYTSALQALGKALKSKRERDSSGTLCAMLLLLHYERFLSFQGGEWVSHAGGLRNLIRQRGPERHRHGIDHAVLMASRGYIISESLINREKCFLDDEKWRDVQFAAVDSPFAPENYVLYHRGLNYFASVPGLFQDTKQSRNDVDKVLMYKKATALREQMIRWHEDFSTSSKQQHRTLGFEREGHPEDHGYYSYRDPMTASFAVTYCAYLILVNQALQRLGQSMFDVVQMNAGLARDIGRSAFYCSRTGFCGAQTMALAFPIALKAAAEEDREWMQTCMKNVEDSTSLVSRVSL